MTMHELSNVFEIFEPAPGAPDELLAWCDAADEVADAYEAWRRAGRGQRALAHAAYVAALDREQAASTALAKAA